MTSLHRGPRTPDPVTGIQSGARPGSVTSMDSLLSKYVGTFACRLLGSASYCFRPVQFRAPQESPPLAGGVATTASQIFRGHPGLKGVNMGVEWSYDSSVAPHCDCRPHIEAGRTVRLSSVAETATAIRHGRL